MKVMLDTNICIALMRGHKNATARLMALAPGDCGVSVVTVYELYTGIEKCLQPERERIKVVRLLSQMSILPFDEFASRRAAVVRAELERAGRVCGPYDLLLAGHALSLGISLATHNLGEFSRVRDLQVENWLA